MRGQKQYYDKYIKEAKLQAKGETTPKTDRNKLLTARFYYWLHIERKRYDDILLNLQAEFFISESRIVECLNECKTDLDQFMELKPEPGQLKNEWPWMVW